jgi:hypothetical protein
MNEYLIPPINSVGRFKLKDPLSKLINPDVNYKVVSVRSIKDMIESDEDVLTFIYLNQGLTETDYQNDVSINIPIVTLISPSEEYLYIPANRILSIPDVTGYRFRRKIISVDLGYVPDDTDLTWLEDEIKDLVTTMYGVNPEVDTLDASPTYLYTKQDYDEFETSRTNTVTNTTTCYGRLKEIEKKLALMKDKLKAVLKIQS